MQRSVNSLVIWGTVFPRDLYVLPTKGNSICRWRQNDDAHLVCRNAFGIEILIAVRHLSAPVLIHFARGIHERSPSWAQPIFYLERYVVPAFVSIQFQIDLLKWKCHHGLLGIVIYLLSVDYFLSFF